MRTTMDKAGRVVIPREMRERIGLTPGPIDIVVDGAAVRIEVPLASIDDVVERDGRLLLPSRGGASLTQEQIRELRFTDQR